MAKSRYKKKKITVTNVLAAVVVLVVSFMTLGYSAFHQTGLITDTGATVHAERDIRVTGVTVTNPVSGALSNYEEYEPTSISTALQLPNSDSKMTYEVEITNFGNIEMGLHSISGLPNNLKYSLDPTNYKLDEMICDDLDETHCTLAAVKKVYITIEYDTNGYNANNTTYTFQLEFTFTQFDKVAQIGQRYYSSLQDALDKVPKDGTQTTVILLKNRSESVKTYAGQDITLNLQNNTLRNNPNDDLGGNDNVIKNYGTLRISNGRIFSDAATNGAVNNYQYATIYISGGRIEMTGGRQALWNDKGTVYISDNAYLSSTTNQRSTVQTTAGGTMYITGGTIISTGGIALNNAGTLTIGTQGGEVSTTSPLFKAYGDGISSTVNFAYYDGVIKARGSTITDASKANPVESGYGPVTSSETIDGQAYHVTYLAISKAVNFHSQGGQVSESVRYVEIGHQVGPLPTASRSGYTFDGWFTSASGGTQVSASYVVNDTTHFYAHWTQVTEVCQIGQTLYATLSDAITAAGNSTVTIEMIKNSSEDVTITSGQNITIDLGGYTLTNVGKRPIITTAGTLTVTNGSFSTDATQAAINVTGGTLTVDSVTMSATQRQTIYITGGTTVITGDTHLTSATSGKPSGSNMERGTIQVISGTLRVESGEIIATAQQAISNEGTVYIGVQGGTLDATNPVLRGFVNGVKSTGTLYFYDGIIKGGTNAVNGTITGTERNITPTDGSETIGGKTYYTKYLEEPQP